MLTNTGESHSVKNCVNSQYNIIFLQYWMYNFSQLNDTVI